MPPTHTSWNAPRCIAHLDMDAFYASVELLRHPELRGKPVAIGGRGNPASRGVVTTANYEARVFGVRSAMPLRQAYELCPHCVFLPVDFDEYRRFSRRFKLAIAAVCPTIEDRGVDEVYLDLTSLLAAGPLDVSGLGQALKNAVLTETGLTCSVGLAPNKLLAKIASDLEKPDGLTMIQADDIAARIWPLPARRVNGIGPKAEARLASFGIHTIGDLARADPQFLLDEFGRSYGRWLHEASHGRDERPVVTFSEPKSLSRETTFDRDLHLRRDWHALAALLSKLCRQVVADLDAKRYLARTVGVKVRFDDFRIVTRDISLAEPGHDPVAIRKAAFECLARVPEDRPRLRLLGVRLGSLSRAGEAPAAMAAAEAKPPTPDPDDPNLPLF